MPTFEIKDPSGTYRITAADENEAMAVLAKEVGGGAPEGPSGSQVENRIVTRGAVGALAGPGALINDAVQGPMNLIYRGIDAVAGTDLGERHSRATGGAFGSSSRVSEIGKELAGKVGPAPTSGAGRIAEEAATGAIEAIGGSGLFRVGGKIFSSLPEVKAAFDALAAGPKTQAAYGAAAAGGAQAAQEAGVNPLIGTAAGLAAAATGHAVGAGVRAAPRAIDDALLRSDAAKEAAATTRLRTQASDTGGLEDWARRGDSGELVPGSRPTLYEATGDPGIGKAENTAFQRDAELGGDRGTYREAMGERRGEQNLARLAEVESLGGEGRKQALLDEFRRQRDEMDNVGGFREGVAQSEAEAATSRIATDASPEDVGAGIREPMAKARADAKAEARKLYEAIGDQGVTVGTGELKKTVGQHFQATPEKRLSADENYYADLIKGYGPQIDFKRLGDLSSEVSGFMRDYTLPENTRRRFGELRTAIDRAMEGGLSKAIDTDTDLFQRAASAQPSPGPIDQGLTEQKRAADRNYRELKLTYDKGAAGAALKRADTREGYTVSDARLGEITWKGGATGGERIRSLRAAGARDEDLIAAAAYNLQQRHIKDGVLDPNGFARWRGTYGPALAELPEQARKGFQSANDAAVTLQRVQAEHAASLKAFDQSAVGEMLRVDPRNLEKEIGGWLKDPAAAQDVARAAGGNEAARDALRRVTADYLGRQFLGPSGELSKAAFTGFTVKNRAALAAIFGSEGAERITKLTRDIERSRALMRAGKDPGGSATAGNVVSVAKDVASGSVLSWLLGPKAAVATAVGKRLLSNMKLAGMADVDALYARALLDPELARKLLTRAPALKSAPFVKSLGTAMLRSSLLGAARTAGVSQ